MKLARVLQEDGQPQLCAVVAGRDGAQYAVSLGAAAAAAGHGLAGPQSPLRAVRPLLEVGKLAMDAARDAVRYAQQRGVEDRTGATPLQDARLGAPIARPGKVLALAGNYRSHRSEGGVASP